MGVVCVVMQGQCLTRKQQPELPSHALRNPLEDQLLRLLSPIHAHPLPVLGEVVLPRLLLQELLSLSRSHYGKEFNTNWG